MPKATKEWNNSGPERENSESAGPEANVTFETWGVIAQNRDVGARSQEGSMRHFTLGLICVAVIGAAAPASADAPVGVGMSLGFPTPIQMFAGGDPPDPNRTQDVTAEYLLTDLANEPITLSSASDCAAHAWTVTDPSGTVVDQSAACAAGGAPASLTVPQGKPVDESQIVTLKVFAYKEGLTYTLHYKAYGVEGTANFAVSLLK